jgi:cysteine synthase
MIEDAEKRIVEKKDSVIIEATSGNTGGLQW